MGDIYVVKEAQVIAENPSPTGEALLRLHLVGQKTNVAPLDVDIHVRAGRAGAILDHLTTP